MSTKWLLLAAAAALASVACGAPQQAAPSAGMGGEPAQAGTPKPGGVLNVRWSEDPWDFDMTYTGQSTVNSDSMKLAYNSLLTFKVGPDVRFDEFIVQPALAESWEVSPDARTYTFHLRKGVKWANLPPLNGREFTSADVKWSYEYFSRTGQFKDKKLPQSQVDWMFEGMEAVETPDSYTAIVRFKEPMAPFLNYAATGTNPITPHEIYDADGDLKSRIVGTGPFQLDTAASQKGTRWVFKKNPDYWDTGKPYIDEVRQLLIKDDSAAYAAFQTKQIDHLSDVSDPVTAQTIANNNPQAQKYEFLYSGLYLLMQTKKAPVSDPQVRRAISMALDRDEYIKTMAGGKGAWSLAGEGPLSDLFTQEEIKSITKQDVEGARKLLADAGYPNGVTVEMHVPTDRGDKQIKQSELIQAMLKRAGITMNLKTMPYSDVSAKRKAHDFMMDYFSEFPRPDIDAVIYSTFYPGAKSNYTEVDDPRLTQLLLAQRQQPDPTKRREILREAVRYIAENALGTSIARDTRYAYAQPYVKNFAPHMDRGISNYAAAAIGSWLDK